MAVGKEIFVDSTATGAADGTSWTDAYTTIQAGLDSIDYTAGWNDVMINTEAFVLSSALNFASVTGSPTIDNQLRIIGVNNGGSVTITVGGSTIPACEIDGNDAVANIFSSPGRYMTVQNVYMHDSTSFLIDSPGDLYLHSCHLHNAGASTAWLDGANDFRVRNCAFTGSTGTIGLEITADNRFTGNFIEGTCSAEVIILQNSDNVIDHNTIVQLGAGHGVLNNVALNQFERNTVVGPASGTASKFGIYQAKDDDPVQLIENLFARWNGASGGGVSSSTSPLTVHTEANCFWDCTANYGANVERIAWVADATDETGDPFTSIGTDFSLDSGANSHASNRTALTGADRRFPTSATVNGIGHIGAWQEDNAGGGGGSDSVVGY